MGKATVCSLCWGECVRDAGTELVCGQSGRTPDESGRKGDETFGREAKFFPHRWQMSVVGIVPVLKTSSTRR